MTQQDSGYTQVDEDKLMKSQMEQMVDSYDSYMRKMTFGRESVLRKMTVELAHIKPGNCVLEAGCGTGTLTLAAKGQAGPSGQVFGIDLIPGMIEISQRKAALANVDIPFQLGSMDDIPFPENKFAVVLCSFMIFHMSEPVRRKGMAEIQRVLKPNGRLLILDLALPAQPLPRIIARMVFAGMLNHDLKELLPLMEGTGFSDVEMAQARFRVLGLAILGYVTGLARKS